VPISPNPAQVCGLTAEDQTENQPVEKVKEFKAKIKAADAILIAMPECDYPILGVLKNAIDCASLNPMKTMSSHISR
jgi:NAD(P)H-dependent FMN reductase